MVRVERTLRGREPGRELEPVAIQRAVQVLDVRAREPGDASRTDERVRLIPDRIKYWVGVGAQPSENVAVFIRKYMAKFEQQAAEAPAPAAAAAEGMPIRQA